MKNLSIAIVTASCLAVGTVGIAPAMAVNLTQLDYSGSITGKATADLGFLDVTLFDETIEFNNISFTVDNLSGRLQDSGDSQLTIDSPFQLINDAIFLDLVGDIQIPALPDDIDIATLLGDFDGTGEVYSGGLSDNGPKLSDFYFSYDSATDVFTVDGYDFASIESCLDGTCSLFGGLEQELSISLPVFGEVDLSGEVSFAIAQTATPLNNDVSSVPEPSALLGLAVVGGFVAAKRKRKAA